MSSHNSSFSAENDSLNHSQQSGLNILLPRPFQGGREDQSPSLPVAPFIPQPMGVINTAPLQILPPVLAFSHVGSPSGLPSTPGQLSVGSPVQSSKYNVMSNSLPVLGERQSNLIPQGGNIILNSHNSSPWSSGFTSVLQDNSLDLSRARQLPSSPEFVPKVSQTSRVMNFSSYFMYLGI